MTRPRLLLVDDEAEILELLTMIFADCDVHTALNVECAKTILRAQTFDLIVTDLKMPGGSGLGLIEFSKQYWPALPVIIITGHDPALSPDEALKVHSCVRKPFGKAVIRKAVAQALATTGINL